MKDHELMAIDFIARHGTDTVGVIDSEDKLAAAWLYVNLCQRGYLIASIGEHGPTYRLTQAGKRIAASIRNKRTAP